MCRVVDEEEVAQLQPGGHRRCRQVEQLGAWRAYKGHGELVGLCVVVSADHPNCLLVCLDKGGRISRAVIARRHLRSNLGGPCTCRRERVKQRSPDASPGTRADGAGEGAPAMGVGGMI